MHVQLVLLALLIGGPLIATQVLCPADARLALSARRPAVLLMGMLGSPTASNEWGSRPPGRAAHLTPHPHSAPADRTARPGDGSPLRPDPNPCGRTAVRNAELVPVQEVQPAAVAADPLLRRDHQDHLHQNLHPHQSARQRPALQ